MGQAATPDWRTSTSHDHGSPSGHEPGRPRPRPTRSADASHAEAPGAGTRPAGLWAGAVG